MELTISGHGFIAGDKIKIADGSLTFKCNEDSYASTHAYPRSSDPYSNKWLSIYDVTLDTFKVFVGLSPNVTPHQFYSATVEGVQKHNSVIRIKGNSLTFTCSMDNDTTFHSYPRTTDPYYNKDIAVEANTANTITVNIGKSPTVNYQPQSGTYNATTGALEINIGSHSLPAPTTHTVTNAAYVPSTGIMTLTIAGHNFSNGEKVKIADNSLRFTCAQDNNCLLYTSPRPRD